LTNDVNVASKSNKQKTFYFFVDVLKVRALLGLSQDGVCTDSFENFSKSLKRDQSNDTKFNPPLFSLVNTFKRLARLFAQEFIMDQIAE
jgi:hypothetical protein